MVGNYRGALSAVACSLELEKVAFKKSVTMLWMARILDLLDHRDRSSKIFEELAQNPDNSQVILKAAKNGLRTPFNEKKLSGMMIDFQNGDSIE